MREKNQSTHAEALEGIAHSLPALIRASKIQSRAAAFGYQAPQSEGKPMSEQEIGDALFALAARAMQAGIDPEAALTDATERFMNRFAKLERTLVQNERASSSLTEAEKAALWKTR